MSSPVYRFATVSDHEDVHWLLKRNCSVTPAQLGWMYVSLCAVSLAIATLFWFLGATLILPFAWLELSVLGVSFLVYARHATDGERISLLGKRLVVETENAGRLVRVEFEQEWVRIEPSVADTSLIEVSERGRSVRIGRFVRPELRPALARELKMVLLRRRHEAAAATDVV